MTPGNDILKKINAKDLEWKSLQVYAQAAQIRVTRERVIIIN